MGKQAEKKFGWVIKNLSSLQSEKCCSVSFLISDCKWRLVAYPKGNNGDDLSLYLDVADCESLPCGWSRYVKLRLILVNQLSQKLSILKETEHLFDGKSTTWGFPSMLPLSKLNEKDGGFLVNGELIIVAEVDVLEVIGTLDDSEKSEEASQPLNKIKQNDCWGSVSNDLLKKTSTVMESNGIKQVEDSVKSSSNNKRLKIVFLVIFVIFLIGSIGAVHEDLAAAIKRISALEKLMQK